jgi:hypothetical protein
MPPVETSPFRERSGSTMKNVLGKIFVFGVFVMSLMLMSFAVAIYSSHVNWQEVAKKKQEDLDKLKAEESSLNQEINAADGERRLVGGGPRPGDRQVSAGTHREGSGAQEAHGSPR